jgi:hypothetical protein
MFKAMRSQMQATPLPRETRPQRGRRKRSHARRERRQQVEATGDDDPAGSSLHVSIDPRLPFAHGIREAGSEAAARESLPC